MLTEVFLPDPEIMAHLRRIRALGDDGGVLLDDYPPEYEECSVPEITMESRGNVIDLPVKPIARGSVQLVAPKLKGN